MSWQKTNEERWDRSDGAVVKIDHSTECGTARPWLPNYRGWMAFGPGPDEYNHLKFYRKNSRFSVIRKFKTPESAMRAVDREHPEKVFS